MWQSAGGNNSVVVAHPHNTALGSGGQGQKGFSFAFLEFSGFLFAFSDLLTDVGEHVWASWSVRRGAYRGRARSCEYLRCAPSHRGPVGP